MAEEKEIVAPAADEAEEEQEDLITLSDGEGNEVTFEKLDELDCEGTHYIAVMEKAEPGKTAESDGVMVILYTGEDEDGEFFEIVEDDEQLLKLGKLFEKRLSDKYEISQ